MQTGSASLSHDTNAVASVPQAAAPANLEGQRPAAVATKAASSLGTAAQKTGSLSTPNQNGIQRSVTLPASPISIEEIQNKITNSNKVNIENLAQNISNIPLDQANELPQIFDTLAQKGNAESNFGNLLDKVNNYNDKLEIIKYLDSNKETKDLANKLFQGLDAYTQARILRLLTTENYNKTNETKDDGAQLATNLVKAEKNANPEIINDIKGKLESIQQDNTLSKIANFSETCNNLLIGINNVTNTSLKGNEQVITKYTPPSAGESESKAEGQQQVGNAASTNSKVEGQETKVVSQESEQGEMQSSIMAEMLDVAAKGQGTVATALQGGQTIKAKAPQVTADTKTIINQPNEKEMIERQRFGAIKMSRDVETQKYMGNAVGNDLPQQMPSPSSLTVATQKPNFLNSPAPKPLKKQQLPNFPAPQSPLEMLKSNTNIDEILKNLTLNHIIQLIDDEKNETNFQTLNKLHTIITKFLQDQNKTTELSDDLILKLIKKQDAVYEQLKKLINTNTDIKQTIEISNNQTLPYFNERILNLLINNPKEKNDLITFLEGIKNYCNDQTVKDTLAKDQDLQSTTNKLLDNIKNVLTQQAATGTTVPPPPAVEGPKPPQRRVLPPPPPRQKQPSAPQSSAEGNGVPPEELPPPTSAPPPPQNPLGTGAPAAPSGRADLLSQIQQGTTLKKASDRVLGERPQVVNAGNITSILKNVVPVIQTETNPDDTISDAEWDNHGNNINFNFLGTHLNQTQPATGNTASKVQRPQAQTVARTEADQKNLGVPLNEKDINAIRSRRIAMADTDSEGQNYDDASTLD